jgi:hypothetical protein
VTSSLVSTAQNVNKKAYPLEKYQVLLEFATIYGSGRNRFRRCTCTQSV